MSKIEEGRRLLGLDMVVRTETGEAATETNTPIIQLFKLHRQTIDKNKNLRSLERRTSVYNTGKVAASRLRGSMLLSQTSSQSNVFQRPSSRHIIINMKSFICRVGEETELYFSLYHATNSKVITDQFQVILTAQGAPIDTKRVNDMRTIFLDIPPLIPLSDLWLVCKVVRKGGMHSKETSIGKTKKKDDAPELRRPFGYSALNLGTVGLKRDKEVEKVVEIFYHTKDENQYHNLFNLINNRAKEVDKVPTSTGITIGLTMASGSIEEVYQADPNLRMVPVTPPLDITGYESDNFKRNDMYITLKEGEFSSSASLELSGELRLGNGQPISGCCFAGTSYAPHAVLKMKSLVFHKTSTPVWNDMFLLRLNQVESGLHIFFALRNVDKKDKGDGYCFGKLDLVNPDYGSIIYNGTYTVQLIKPPKSIDPRKDPTWYLKPLQVKEKKSESKTETIRIEVAFVSNQLTQNTYLHALFNWRNIDPSKMREVLGKITFAGPEIVKFLKQTFDSLFEILDSKNPSLEYNVFIALTSVIEMLTDEKKQRDNFKPMLDTYVSEQFKSSMAQESLLTHLRQYFMEYETKKSTELINIIKSLEYVLKFIIQSRVVSLSQGTATDTQNFKAKLMDFFGQINKLLRNRDRQFVGIQTTIVKKLSPLFDLMLKIFTPIELANTTVNFLVSIPYDESTKILSFEKLSFVQRLVNGNLFTIYDARNMLLPVIVGQLETHLHFTFDEETQICIMILLQLLDGIQSKAEDTPYIQYIVPLLPILIQLVEVDGGDELMKYDIVMALLGIYFFMSPQHFGYLISAQPNDRAQKQFLENTFNVLFKFITKKSKSFPENWFVMLMFMYSTVLKVIIVLAHFMKQRFLIIDQELDLWATFFQLILACVNSNVLDLESFADSKRKIILERYGDMRMELIQILMLMWFSLDTHQYKFIDQLVLPFFQLVVLEQPIISSKGVELYFSLIIREHQMLGSFKKIEGLTIEMLDNIFDTIFERSKQIAQNEDERKEHVQKWFHRKIGNSYDPHSPIGGQVNSFLDELSQFLGLVYDLRSLPDDTIWNDERAVATLNLMGYLVSTGRLDQYKKYVHSLVKQHVESENYGEAGYALLLHSNQLQYSNELYEEPHGDFPRQTYNDRKVALHRKAIEYFDQAKMWEMCIRLLNELRVTFEREIFDYKTLSELVLEQSKFYQKIAGPERFFCEYFRVGYYGRGFPKPIRNKEFIYRGFELERLTDFTQRIQFKYPLSKLLTYTEQPPDDIINSDDQYLQIFSVKPSTVEEATGKPVNRSKGDMPASIQKFYSYNDINVFLYSKPFRKNKQKGETQVQEFADLWIKNIYYVTQDTFPTVQKRSEISHKYEKESTPCENAIFQIEEKNREIVQVSAKHDIDGATLSNQFTMVLKGVIDAAVNGGTKLYIEAFLSEEFIRNNQMMLINCEKLSRLVSEQRQLLDKGLQVHKKLCPPDMLGLHEQLEMQMVQIHEEAKSREPFLEALFKECKSLRETPPPPPTVCMDDEIDLSLQSVEELWKVQGEKEAKTEIAMNLLRYETDEELITSVTGLTKDQLTQLKVDGGLVIDLKPQAIIAKNASQTYLT